MKWKLMKMGSVLIGFGLALLIIYKWFIDMCALGAVMIAAAGFGAFFLALFKMTAVSMIATGCLLFIGTVFIFAYAIADSEEIDYDFTIPKH